MSAPTPSAEERDIHVRRRVDFEQLEYDSALDDNINWNSVVIVFGLALLSTAFEHSSYYAL